MIKEKISFHEFLVSSAKKTNAKAVILSFIGYKQGEVQESEITNEWLMRFCEYIDERLLSANTRSKYISVLTHVLEDADLMGYKLPIMDKWVGIKKKVTISTEASEAIFLNKAELKLLEAYVPATKSERFTRAIFLICAYTGCRISDAQLLSKNNFNDGEINFTSCKTKSTSKLPLHPIIPILLKDVKGKIYDENSVKVIVGRDMKHICEKLGINKLVTLYRRGTRMTEPKFKMVSSHTGRRSFATNMFLDGYRPIQISIMMGHGKGKGDLKMTSGYLCVSHTDDVNGDKNYLYPNSDRLYEKLTKMIGLGLSVEQACSVLVVNGVTEVEIGRVKIKFIERTSDNTHT